MRPRLEGEGILVVVVGEREGRKYRREMTASVYIPPGGQGDVRLQLAQVGKEDGRKSVRQAIDRGFKWSLAVTNEFPL